MALIGWQELVLVIVILLMEFLSFFLIFGALGFLGFKTRILGFLGFKEDPLIILKIRLAKGEITKEEYEEMKKVLEE